MEELYKEFVIKLKKLFGKFDDEQKRFEKASNSKISRDLGYSDAQFSRLINETATEGEYKRAIQNVDRILRVRDLENQIKSDDKRRSWTGSHLWFLLSVLMGIALIVIAVQHMGTDAEDVSAEKTSPDDMLRWTFETSFVNPYTKLNDLPADCNFPCYKYQGNWHLKDRYKIPFFRERSGFHYVAVEVNMYARCLGEVDSSGRLLEGYEYQKHEIWYDKRELPIDSFFNQDATLKTFYQNMNFEEEEPFVKVATVHTFFRNEFTIDSTRILRKGKVIGRDLEFISGENLKEHLGKSVWQEIEGELNRIATNRLADFSRPIACTDAVAPSADFNLITEGDDMSFDCQLTTSRFAIDYTKTYILTDQYIKNVCH